MGQLEHMQLKNYPDRKVFEEAKAKLNVIPEDQDVRGLETRLDALKKDNNRLKDLLRCANEINNDMKKKAQDDRRNEMVKINEALQYLIRKRTKAKYKNEWKLVEQKGFCVNLALQALDDHTKKLR